MSFNRSRGFFTCPPNCPDRKPACQDHCETYARDKARHDEYRAKEQRKHEVDQYVITAHAKKLDDREKSRKAFSGHYWAKRR